MPLKFTGRNRQVINMGHCWALSAVSISRVAGGLSWHRRRYDVRRVCAQDHPVQPL